MVLLRVPWEGPPDGRTTKQVSETTFGSEQAMTPPMADAARQMVQTLSLIRTLQAGQTQQQAPTADAAASYATADPSGALPPGFGGTGGWDTTGKLADAVTKPKKAVTKPKKLGGTVNAAKPGFALKSTGTKGKIGGTVNAGPKRKKSQEGKGNLTDLLFRALWEQMKQTYG